MATRLTLTALATIATAAIAAQQVTAAPILQINGGTAGTIPAGAINDVITGFPWLVTEVPGYYGGTLFLTEAADVTFEFIGFEAGFENTFNLDLDAGIVGYETVVFDTEDFAPSNDEVGDPLDGPFLATLSAGNVPFAFIYNAGAGQVANDGTNPDDAGGSVGPNYFLSFFGPTATYGSFPNAAACAVNAVCNPRQGTVSYAWLDDGGASNDDNHDDMVVRTSVVPEPATLGLLGAGLLGLGAMLRRRRMA